MEAHYFVIDVETANLDNSSICQIGLAEFDGMDLISTWESIINPNQFFDPYLSRIHGITAEQVQGKPGFKEISEYLENIIKGRRLFHHMPFDRNAINRACSRYDALPWSPKWLDSAKLVRRAWPEFAYSGYALGKITAYLGIEYQAHHALFDAIATGKVIQKAISHTQIPISEWETRISLPLHNQNELGSIHSFKKEGNPKGILFGESAVFTGTLSQPRHIYAQIASDAGCRIQDGVNKETTLLVVGWQDSYRLAGYEKSSKHRKAEELSQKGFPIRILSEDDFVTLIQTQID
jgi:DNA polymerase-3 subunit epsilon